MVSGKRGSPRETTVAAFKLAVHQLFIFVRKNSKLNRGRQGSLLAAALHSFDQVKVLAYQAVGFKNQAVGLPDLAPEVCSTFMEP